ncbi:SDR family oxidoreductase [Nonomuraea sp. NPDC049269]|uniref:SDR family oxidoreductase n=1 Tax=Nonomuraea sp. NPDC049269 TaxID=3364349 RepID=UPI0037186853
MNGDTVLVTGGSGFLAGFCVARLLQEGYRVRTTVRSAAREREVREAMEVAGVVAGDSLSFVVADLTSDAHWAEAVEGCAYVLHVASPLPAIAPKDENEVLVPAVEGTLRVLRAARDAGVRRIVVTSSFVAIGYGHPATDRAFTEEDWTDTDGPGVTPYVKSKVLAERAAWDFMDREGGSLELAVVNPVGIFGPVIGPHLASSVGLIKSLMDGRLPGAPDLSFAVVDVRDAADLHLRAMTDPGAAGQRFIATAGDTVSLHQVCLTLRRRLGEGARKVPARRLPSWLIRFVARFAPAMRGIAGDLGLVRHVDNAKARTVLDWRPRSSEDSVTATAQSLLDLGLVKQAKRS